MLQESAHQPIVEIEILGCQSVWHCRGTLEKM